MNLFPPGLFEFSKGAVPFATEAQDTFFPNQGGWLDQADAFRHLVWMGEMQRKMGKWPAKVVGEFKEATNETYGPLDSIMDRHNNNIALKYMKDAKTQADVLEIAQRLLSQAKVINTREEYEQIKDLDVPFFLGEFARNNPGIFEDTTK